MSIYKLNIYMIVKSIHNAFKIKESRNWEKIYFAIDIHGTILKSNYKSGDISKEFYPHAKAALQELTKRNDIVLILYTCSFPHEIDLYLKYFEENGIHFEYVNSNPEIESNDYGCFDSKFYFNVLFDDKASFDAEKEWHEVLFALKKIKQCS